MQIITERHRNAAEILKMLPEGFGVQLINDNIVMSPAPKDVHQKVLDKIYRRLGNFVEDHHLGETRVAPSDVFFNNKNIFQPDIYFVSNEQLQFFKEDGFHGGAPDLIIEILSDSSIFWDKIEKRAVYEKEGVKEFWIVDPKIKTATGFWNTSGGFEQFFEEKGKLNSHLLKTTFSF